MDDHRGGKIVVDVRTPLLSSLLCLVPVDGGRLLGFQSHCGSTDAVRHSTIGSARLTPTQTHTHTPTPQNHPQQLIGRINKVGVLSPRFDVKYGEYENWVNNVLPSRQVRLR